MAIFSVVRFEEREKNKYLLVKQCRKISEDEYELEGIEMKVGGFGSQNAETSITYPNIRDIPRLFFPKEEEVVKKKVEDYVEVLVILETIACSNLFMLIPKMSLPLFIIDDADVSFYQQSFDVFTKIASIEYLKQHGLEERANLIQHYIHLLDFREALQKPLKSSTDHRGNITVQGVFDRQMLSDLVQFVTEKELRSSITIKKSALLLRDKNKKSITLTSSSPASFLIDPSMKAFRLPNSFNRSRIRLLIALDRWYLLLSLYHLI